MAYKVIFRDDARKAFTGLDSAVRKRIGKRIGKLLDRLGENPRPGQPRS